MLKPGYNTHFLEVSAYFSPKVTTNGSFRDKKKQKFSTFKAIFGNLKRRCETKKIDLSLINLELVYLVQLHIFWK